MNNEACHRLARQGQAGHHLESDFITPALHLLAMYVGYTRHEYSCAECMTEATHLKSISLPGGLQPVLGRLFVLAALKSCKLLLILLRRLSLHTGRPDSNHTVTLNETFVMVKHSTLDSTAAAAAPQIRYVGYGLLVGS